MSRPGEGRLQLPQLHHHHQGIGAEGRNKERVEIFLAEASVAHTSSSVVPALLGKSNCSLKILSSEIGPYQNYGRILWCIIA